MFFYPQTQHMSWNFGNLRLIVYPLLISCFNNFNRQAKLDIFNPPLNYNSGYAPVNFPLQFLKRDI